MASAPPLAPNTPPPGLRAIEIDVPSTPGGRPEPLIIPADSPEEAFTLLYEIGNGSTGAVAHAGVLQAIRATYKTQLEAVEREILQRRAALGANATEYELRGLAQWAARRRAMTARLSRIPTPLVGLGLEARDWRTYGPGGRTFDNLLRRQASRGNTGSAAYSALLSSATRSNAQVNASMARGAKLLRGGGGVLAVAGLALTASDIYSAPPERRGAVAQRHAIGFAGGLIGAEVGVGLLTIGAGLLLASPPGWIVLAVGLVGGIAGGIIADRIFYPQDYKGVGDHMAAGIAIDPSRGYGPLPLRPGELAPTRLPIISAVNVVVVSGDTHYSLSRRALLQAGASAGLDPSIREAFADRHASPTGLSWSSGDPSPGDDRTVREGDITRTAGQKVIYNLNADQRDELARMQGR